MYWKEIDTSKLKKGDLVNFNNPYVDLKKTDKNEWTVFEGTGIGIVKEVEKERLYIYNDWVYIMLLNPKMDMIILKNPVVYKLMNKNKFKVEKEDTK